MFLSTLFVNQVYAGRNPKREVASNWLVATVHNKTRFVAHVTVYYVTAPNKPEKFDVPAGGTASGSNRLLLLKSVSATYDAALGGASVINSISFEPTVGVTYGNFVITENAEDIDQKSFTCKIHRSDKEGLQTGVSPGFSFTNTTMYKIEVSLGLGAKFKKTLNQGERWEIETGSLWLTISASLLGSDVQFLQGIYPGKTLNTSATLFGQYTGASEIFSKHYEKPHYIISGYTKVVAGNVPAVTDKLCLERVNDVNTNSKKMSSAGNSCNLPY